MTSLIFFRLFVSSPRQSIETTDQLSDGLDFLVCSPSQSNSTLLFPFWIQSSQIVKIATKSSPIRFVFLSTRNLCSHLGKQIRAGTNRRKMRESNPLLLTHFPTSSWARSWKWTKSTQRQLAWNLCSRSLRYLTPLCSQKCAPSSNRSNLKKQTDSWRCGATASAMSLEPARSKECCDI